jgi:hypothetical protein
MPVGPEVDIDSCVPKHYLTSFVEVRGGGRRCGLLGDYAVA